MPVPTRRDFLKSSAAFSLGLPLLDHRRILGANERLNIGVIGVAGRGSGNINGVKNENIVALCDVDRKRLGKAGDRFKDAKKYVDYRVMLEHPDLDAVVVSTPDHHHAPAAYRALKKGLHVYCEKPLTHTPEEARILTETARTMQVATQMGNQNHARKGNRRTVELIRGGAIGDVREVHVMTDRPGSYWKQGLPRPIETPDVPKHLDWDLWLGPAEERPYHGQYVPFHWRGWWDFGCGAVGDMACHLMDCAWWALDLGGPVRVAAMGPPVLSDCGPTWMIVRFEFRARGSFPACNVYWYEGTAKPAGSLADDLPVNGTLFVGDEGRIKLRHTRMPELLPEKKFKDFKGPETSIPDRAGHHQQWIDAAKGKGAPADCHFDYSGPFTEAVLLANVAYRTGRTIDWDPSQMVARGVPEAARLIRKSYRKGWEVG